MSLESNNVIITDNQSHCFYGTCDIQGYPSHNSGFGHKTASFSCRGMTIASDFEVFFR